MATTIAFNVTVEKIIGEVEKFDKIEQEAILAYIRARRIQKNPKKTLVSTPKSLSMATIDSIKHKSRQHAGK